MSTTSYNLFVYGSLRSGFRNPAYEYITRYFKCQGDAMVKGKFYDAGTHPVAKTTEDEQFILGELYTINSAEEFSWAFEQLDDYEGVNVEPGEVPMYVRTVVDVYQVNEKTQAWVYWFNGNVEALPQIENGDVMKYLQQKNQA